MPERTSMGYSPGVLIRLFVTHSMVGVSKRINWLDVELRTRVALDPSFGALVGWEHYRVVLSYRFDKNDRNTAPANQFNKTFDLNAVIGARFFPIEGVEVLPNEEFGQIGMAPSLGIELLHKRSGVSFNAEQDLWLSFNGGSSRREVKGEIVSRFIGFRYHAQLKSDRHLRFGLGYSLIKDLDQVSRWAGSPIYISRSLYNHQVKGLGVTLSYELFYRADVELKHTFPIQSLNEPLFNPIRFSVGVLYRLSNI